MVCTFTTSDGMAQLAFVDPATVFGGCCEEASCSFIHFTLPRTVWSPAAWSTCSLRYCCPVMVSKQHGRLHSCRRLFTNLFRSQPFGPLRVAILERENRASPNTVQFPESDSLKPVKKLSVSSQGLFSAVLYAQGDLNEYLTYAMSAVPNQCIIQCFISLGQVWFRQDSRRV